MLRLDRDGERFVFENEWDLLIPYSVERYDGKEAEITVIPRISRAVRAALRRLGDDLFSDTALRQIWSLVSPHEAEWGYIGGKYRWKRTLIYRMPNGASPAAPRREVRLLTEADEGINRTTYRIDESIRAGCLAVGAMENGQLVSVAVTHGNVADLPPNAVVELGIETTPDARGRGYASSCLAYITAVLLDRGLIPEYRCTRSNRASSATASGIGYRRVGEALDLLMRRAPAKRTEQ